MISLPQVHELPPGEGCGTCTACCDVVGVDALGKPYYARCPHLHSERTTGGCGIYETRPQQCAKYRCAWHLGLLGPRMDRRPLECGVLFQFEQDHGRWRLSAYETRPGALLTDKTQFLIQFILTSKKTRHLSLLPAVHLVPYGADVPVQFPIDANTFDYHAPPRGIPTRPFGQMKLWDGGMRELLMPRRRSNDA
ncbi:MAG: uncharacterized protein QOE14_2513 [Humisphaera sp.]|nr:uncharacterized protein [Humisphaera sp.]